jgi:opacity protein-like surface antigen
MKKSVKRTARILCAAVAAVLVMSTTYAFAAAVTTSSEFPVSAENKGATPGKLNLIENFPEKNNDHVPVDTVGIKLFFDGDVTAESVRDINGAEDIFKFSGGKNEKLETKAYFDKKDSGYILVIASKKDDKGNDISLEQKSKYKLTISGKLTSADGKVLGDDEVIDFQTVDMSGNTKIYMLLMALMVVGMVGMTFVSNRRKARAKAEAEGAKVINPYKLAKEKGITVQEAMRIVEREKEKREKRLAAAGIDPKQIAAPKEEAPKGHRVKVARPVSAGGSAYKTGRKALAEKEAKIAERKAREEAARRARNVSNSKKKGRGGKKK